MRLLLHEGIFFFLQKLKFNYKVKLSTYRNYYKQLSEDIKMNNMQ